MNTPAHIIVNLLLLGKQDAPRDHIAITTGAVLPDIPIIVMYAVEKLIRHTPETVIWTERYHQPGWQNFIDTFNSLPFLTVGFLFAWWAKLRAAMLLFGSMILHVFEDLPLHHDDAHRHVFPLSDWRFRSPVSYWDPSHYGNFVSQLEIIIAVVGITILLRRYRSWMSRTLVGSIGLIYALYFVYVLIMWM
ncbi:MAG: hypothetical protein D6690_02810 [Nitrospirae bacterium]|nr:MAG: hypothetical protein D6690_02810 [Nitrospirota bacterium]